MASTDAGESDAPWEKIMPVAALEEGARKCVRLASGRGVLILRVGGAVHCMDHACYHHGGPLLHADIEDLGGHVCIVCPWHNYKIDVATGEGVYVGLDPIALREGRKEGSVRSKGVKQRVHEVREGTDAPDGSASGEGPSIWVKESAPAEVRGVVAEEAAGESPGSAVTGRVRLGPSASGGRSSVRSGSALAAPSAPRIHSSAPWLASSGRDAATGRAVAAVARGSSAAAAAAGSGGSSTAGHPASGATSAGSAGGAPARAKPTLNPKPRRKDPPPGWMASDDYASLPF